VPAAKDMLIQKVGVAPERQTQLAQQTMPAVDHIGRMAEVCMACPSSPSAGPSPDEHNKAPSP
jgi:hypothetical protein